MNDEYITIARELLEVSQLLYKNIERIDKTINLLESRVSIIELKVDRLCNLFSL